MRTGDVGFDVPGQWIELPEAGEVVEVGLLAAGQLVLSLHRKRNHADAKSGSGK